MYSLHVLAYMHVVWIGGVCATISTDDSRTSTCGMALGVPSNGAWQQVDDLYVEWCGLP